MLLVVVDLLDKVLFTHGVRHKFGLNAFSCAILDAVFEISDITLWCTCCLVQLVVSFTCGECEDEDLTKRHQAMHPVRESSYDHQLIDCDFGFTSIQLD